MLHLEGDVIKENDTYVGPEIGVNIPYLEVGIFKYRAAKGSIQITNAKIYDANITSYDGDMHL